MPDASVVGIPTHPEIEKLEATAVLCLSGGGYRATVFDAALRAHADTTLKPKAAFPYPAQGV